MSHNKATFHVTEDLSSHGSCYYHYIFLFHDVISKIGIISADFKPQVVQYSHGDQIYNSDVTIEYAD